jgi:RimJ/RimL family protein N-acetyltransferase
MIHYYAVFQVQNKEFKLKSTFYLICDLLNMANICNISLKGPEILLKVLTTEYRESLAIIANNEQIWSYNPNKLATVEETFQEWFNLALKKQATAEHWPFIVIRKLDNQIIGTSRYYDSNLADKRLNIGYTWFMPDVWGQGINLECKWVMLQYGFEVLKMNRIGFYVDARNLRSCQALLKLGAVQESILRKHMILADGYVRDTVVFSILCNEWPSIKQRFNFSLA